MKLEISKDLFSKFLNFNGLRGEMENKELLVAFNKDSICSNAVSLNKVACVKGLLKIQSTDWGEIGIDNLPLLKNFLNTGNKDDQLFLKKTENKLICELGNARFSGILRNPKYITNILPDDKYDLVKNKSTGNEFQLKDADIKKIINYAYSISSTQLIFSGKSKNLNLTIDNQDNELSIDFELQNEVNDFRVKLPKLFIDLLSVLNGYDLTFSMKNESPVYVLLEDENLKMEYFIAPFLEK